MDFDIEQFKKLKKEQQNKIFKQLYKLGSDNENNKSDYYAGKNIMDVKFTASDGEIPTEIWYYDLPNRATAFHVT